jgi:hypothetical protein
MISTELSDTKQFEKQFSVLGIPFLLLRPIGEIAQLVRAQDS